MPASGPAYKHAPPVGSAQVPSAWQYAVGGVPPTSQVAVHVSATSLLPPAAQSQVTPETAVGLPAQVVGGGASQHSAGVQTASAHGTVARFAFKTSVPVQLDCSKAAQVCTAHTQKKTLIK
jgi:hypothetical protein